MTAGNDAGNETPYAVLVVDDNDWNRDMLVRRLERQGFRVLAAADGQTALDAVAREPLDLILLDIMMPGISGIEVLRRVRAQASTAQLPVIMATAKGDSEDVVEALDVGANDYVTKPLDFPVVLARVKAQLRGRRPAALGPVAAPPSELGPGAVLAGRYRIDQKIGSGNFGTVFRARHLGLENDVALKLLQPAIGASEEAVARFQREGISACRIQHPNAVQVLDFGTTPEGVAFLVMELLSGVSLAEELKRKGPLGVERSAEILLPICDVLAEVHRAGVIHRDIKPANIFLHQGRRGEQIKVLDFGIAKLVGDGVGGQHLTVEGWVLGTPAYMAPERFGNSVYDGRADVYSLGVMLYQMLSGKTPFTAKSNDLMAMVMMHLQTPPPPLAELCPDLPLGVAEVVMSALRKTPSERPTAEALARDFARAAGLGAGERSGWLSATLPTVLLNVGNDADGANRPLPPGGSPPGESGPATAAMRPDRGGLAVELRSQPELAPESSPEVGSQVESSPESQVPPPPTRLFSAAAADAAGAVPPPAAPLATTAGDAVDPLAAAASWDDGWMLSWEATVPPGIANPAPGNAQPPVPAPEPPPPPGTEDEPFTKSERLLLEDVGFLPSSTGLPTPAAAPAAAEGRPLPATPLAPIPAPISASPLLPSAPNRAGQDKLGGDFPDLANLLLGALPADVGERRRRPSDDLDINGMLADLLRNPGPPSGR